MKWHNRLVRYPEVWVLAIGAFVTRFWNYGQPSDVVFDEVYFREFAAAYLSGQFFFDIHPPLVKLLFAGIGGLFGLSPDHVAAGEAGALVLRILPILAGVALVPLVYIIVRQLGLGRRIATFGGLLVLLDNALLVESRFVLMDSILLLAGMGALSCFLAMRRAKDMAHWRWVIAVALCVGILVSIKWSGLALVWLLAVGWFVDGVIRHLPWRRMLGEAVVIMTVVATVYIGSFAVHFGLLTKAGEGDTFMSERFQSSLVGSAHYDKNNDVSFWEKLIEQNHEMYAAQGSLKTAEHPYASPWHSWPMMQKPVYFWQGEEHDGQQGHIYLLGNPVVWWGVVVAVLMAGLLMIFRHRIFKKREHIVLFLLAGYFANFIPFAFIDRPMFLYHYLFALLFGILLACVMISILFDWLTHKYGRNTSLRIYWSLCILVMLGFIYFLPVSYGWPLTLDVLQQHMWLPSWR